MRTDRSQQRANDDREEELRALFEQLTPLDALALRRRIDANRSDDPLVTAFRRFLPQRIVRLRALLADPRRGRR